MKAYDHFSEQELETALENMQDTCTSSGTIRWLLDIEDRYNDFGMNMYMNDYTADFIESRGGLI